jgi:hypothetical protein
MSLLVGALMRLPRPRKRGAAVLRPLAVLAAVSMTVGVLGVASPAFATGDPATQLVLSVPGDLVAGTPTPVTIYAEDGAGNIDPNYNAPAMVSTSAPGASFPDGPETLISQGAGTVAIEIDVAGVATLTPVDLGDLGISIEVPLPVTVDPGPIAAITITAPPAVSAGLAFNYTLGEVDQFGNAISDPAAQAQLSVFSYDPDYDGDLTQEGPGTYTKTLPTVGSGFVAAWIQGNGAVAQAYAYLTVAGATTQLVETVDNATSTAGATTEVTVQAHDVNGYLDPTNNSALAVTSDDANAVINGGNPVTLVNGTVTFPVVLTAAGDQAIDVADTADALSTDATVTVAAGPAAYLTFSSLANSVVAGTPYTFTVNTTDAYGNVAAMPDLSQLTWSANGHPANPVTANYTDGVATITGQFDSAGIGTLHVADVTDPQLTADASITVTAAPADTNPVSGPVLADRIAGPDRFATATAISAKEFPTAGSAGAVVLAGSDDAADSTVGAVLAAAKDAPLLFTTGGTVPSATLAEITRALPAGGTIYLLGGIAAIPTSVATQLSTLGFTVIRLAGTDRYATAVAVAGAVGDNGPVFLATGTDFADALIAAPAAAHDHGVVLLTAGGSMPASVTGYLAAHPGTVYAVGGQAAKAYPAATTIVGDNRYDTSEMVATKFFTAPTNVGVASGATFADALSGGAYLAHLDGPLLLTAPASLSPPAGAYLGANAASTKTAFTFGGSAAISADTQSAIDDELRN